MSPPRPGLQGLDMILDGSGDKLLVLPRAPKWVRTEHVLWCRVDEVGEGLDFRRGPVVDPVVVCPSSKQDVILGLDDPTEEGEYFGVHVEHPVAGLFRNTIQGEQ